MDAVHHGNRAIAALTLALALCLAYGTGPAAYGQKPEPKRYLVSRAAGAINVDGRLDDRAWNQAPWSDAFVDIQGDAKPRPRFETRVKMVWDDEFFYVGANLVEPHVWATLMVHDTVIFQDPDFEVFIDPDGDGLEYYEFEINAHGTSWDLFLPKPYRLGGKAQNSWEIPGLRWAVYVDGTINDARDTDRGWSVELGFPWKAFAEFAHRPLPPNPGDKWRVNFSRVQWPIETQGRSYLKVKGAKEDNWVWSPQGEINMHIPDKWGTVTFAAR